MSFIRLGELDEIIPDNNTPIHELLAIVGKRLIEEATNREWAVFKYLCAYHKTNVDVAIELNLFRKECPDKPILILKEKDNDNPTPSRDTSEEPKKKASLFFGRGF